MQRTACTRPPASAAGLAGALAVALVLGLAGGAGAAVAPGEYCVVGLGASTGGAADGWLAVVDRAGAVTPVTLVPDPGLVDPWDCAIDPTTGHVIVVDERADGGATDGAVYRVDPVGGVGAVTVIASGAPLVNPRGLHLGGDGSLWIADIGASTGGTNDGALYAIPAGGGAPVRLDTPGVLENPMDVDLDPRPFTGAGAGLNLVVIEENGGVIRRVPLAGGAAQTVGSIGNNDWTSLEVGPYGKYFLLRDGNHLWRYDRDTGGAQQVASGGGNLLNDPTGIAVDYWTGDLVVADTTTGVVVIPPNRYLGGSPAASTLAAPGSLPGQDASGVGFSPPLASAAPSAKFGMPTRRAPIPGSAVSISGPTLDIANGEVEFEQNLFIEVTDVTSPLVVRLFDVNSRDGYDESRNGVFDSGFAVRLYDPAGAVVSSATLPANGRVDLDQRIATLGPGGTLAVGGAGIPLAGAGLYRLQLQVTSNDDFNNLGVWVEGFHAYTFSMGFGPLDTFGAAPFLTPMDPVRLFPYLDRGCEYAPSNYDMDSAAGASLQVTSRLGEAFALTLSGFTTHAEDTVDPSPGGGAPASAELDYGLHALEVTISPTTFGDNNVATVRAADFQGWVDGSGSFPPIPVPPGNAAANPTASLATSPGPAFPQALGPTSNTFLRHYLPRYDETPGTVAWAQPARPYAPYAIHSATPLAGDPPAVGQPSTYAVQVTVVNPDPVNALANVTLDAPVPAPALYVESAPNVSGAATATGGGVVATCAAPCSGTLQATWAAIAPGSAETFSYAVQVTPSFAGERLYLTGGPAVRGGGASPGANAAPAPGSTALFTPTWSSGAFPRTESLGPLCDLSVIEGTVTPVAVDLARFEALAGDGEVLVVWETASEFENLGFRLYRRLAGEDAPVLVTPRLVLGQGTSDFSARYAVHDTGLPTGVAIDYWLEDIEFDGDTAWHGPVRAMTRAGAAPLAVDPAAWDALAVVGPGTRPTAPGPASSTAGADAADAGTVTAGSGASRPPTGTTAPPAGAVPAPAEATLEVVARSADHWLLEVRLPRVVTEDVAIDGTPFVRVTLPGFGTTVSPGHPALPTHTFWVTTPSAVSGIALLERNGELLALDAPVLPVATPTADGGSTLAPDPAVYLSAAPWPAEPAVVAGRAPDPAGELVALRIQPTRFRGASGELETDARLLLRLDLASAPGGSLAAATAAAPAGGALAGRPAVKVRTRGEGLVAVDGSALVAAGLDPASDPRLLQVYREGAPSAVRIEGEEDGILDAADRLLLFAPGREDRYGDEEVFWVVAEALPGLRAAPEAGAPVDVPAAPGTAAAHARFEEQRIYLPTILNGEADNFVGSWVFDRPLPSDVPTPGRLAGDVTLHVRLRGGTTFADVPDDHHVTVRVGGSVVLDAVFDGTALFEASTTVPAALAGAGDTLRVEIHPELDSGAPFDLVYLDALALDHHRGLDLRPADDGQLVFTAESHGAVRVAGLADPAGARVWDVTDASLPRALEGIAAVGPDAIAFEATAGLRYALSDGAGLRAPSALAGNAPSDWTLPGAGHGADWLAIAHGSLVAETQVLAAHRESGGLRAAVVDVEDVYDEVAHGRATPLALREFLRRVATTWDPAPRYVLLVGDATYDYRDFLGGVSRNLVPTLLVDTAFVEAASDSALARLDDGDEAPDLAVGRLPVKDAAGLRDLVAKLVAYETEPDDGAVWRRRLLLVADDGLGAGNAPEAARFEATLDAVTDRAPPGFSTSRVELSALPDATAGADANAAIRAGLTDGAAFALYAGHGGARLWADERIFGAADFDTLANPRWPLVVVLNCLNGFFDAPNEESFGEVALEWPDRGAIGVVSSTTVTALAGQDAFAEALADRLLRGNVRPAGDAVLQAMQALGTLPGAEDVVRTFVLLGDPATPLAMPRVPTADAGADAEVPSHQALILDGRASADPEGRPLAFAWRIASEPVPGSGMLLPGADPAQPVFVGSATGGYTVELVVTAGGESSAPARIAVSVTPGATFSCGGGRPAPRVAAWDLLYLAVPLALSARRRRRGVRRASHVGT